MKTKLKNRNESGITLVALIITIIILVILAAVTLKALFNDKLVETAIKAGEDYKLAQGQEMNELGEVNNKVTNIINGGSVGGEDPTPPKPVEIVGAISFGDLSWNNGKASVSITKNSEDSYTIEYKVTNKDNVVTREYAEVASGGTITDLNLGDLVTARLTDGTNHSKPADLNVLDENAPQVTLKLKTGVAAKGKTATVVATVIENESGVASYKFEYKLSTEDSYKSDSNGTITTSEKTKEYEYTNLTEAVLNNLQVTVIDNAGNSSTVACNVTPAKEGMSSEELNTVTHPELVGKTIVGYEPDGISDNTTKDGAERSGYEAQTHERDKTLTWKLWKTDSNNIYLVSNKATSGMIGLGNITGYNNGVKLINEICSNVYSNSTLKEKGVTVRNMRLSDIIGESGTDTTVLKEGITSVISGYETTYIEYNKQIFPKIWVYNERNVTAVKSREVEGSSWLSASDYITADSSTNKMIAYETSWANASMNQNSFTSTAYYNMVIGEATAGNKVYWLSTRWASPHWDDDRRVYLCDFGLEVAQENGVSIRNLVYSGDYNSHRSSLRPFVIIPLSLVTVEETADGNIKISY